MTVVPLLVAGGRNGLVMALPGGLMQDVLAVADEWRQHEGFQEPNEFGAAQRDKRGLVLGGVVDGGGRESEDGGGDQGGTMTSASRSSSRSPGRG
ncbi:hypothetical protein ACIQI8_42145 [Streptomyces sp. NPDC092369]|uniref:hypothetical protein n=1 Tax=Streptomyces sp. NPDC092369 TaxID=3366015 RepID=UPI0037F31F25